MLGSTCSQSPDRAWLSPWKDAGGIVIHRLGGFSLLMPTECVTHEARRLRVQALAPAAICALLAFLDGRQNGEVRYDLGAYRATGATPAAEAPQPASIARTVESALVLALLDAMPAETACKVVNKLREMVRRCPDCEVSKEAARIAAIVAVAKAGRNEHDPSPRHSPVLRDAQDGTDNVREAGRQRPTPDRRTNARNVDHRQARRPHSGLYAEGSAIADVAIQ